MGAYRWLIGDMISELEEKQYRMCTWIKGADLNNDAREILIDAVQHLENTLNALEKVIRMTEE